MFACFLIVCLYGGMYRLQRCTHVSQVLCGHLEWELLESVRIISRRRCTEQQVVLRVMCLFEGIRINLLWLQWISVEGPKLMHNLQFCLLPRFSYNNPLPWFETPRVKAVIQDSIQGTTKVPNFHGVCAGEGFTGGTQTRQQPSVDL